MEEDVARRLGIPPDNDAPGELVLNIQIFFPPEEWTRALRVFWLESKWNPFAVRDTTNQAPCGATIGWRNGVRITSERSVGYAQINTCNEAEPDWKRFYNAELNVKTAHALWERAGGSWSPWYFSAQQLGLL